MCLGTGGGLGKLAATMASIGSAASVAPSGNRSQPARETRVRQGGDQLDEALWIDCHSPEDVVPPTELAALTQTGQHVILRFASLPDNDKRTLVDRLAAALIDHSVFDSSRSRECTWITVMPVVARSRVLERLGHILRAIAEYHRVCADLVAQHRSGTLSQDWRADEHGEHCRFESLLTGQEVEAPLEGDSEWVDPYFFALFVRSTVGMEPVAELLVHDFHDADRILDVVAGMCNPDAKADATTDQKSE
jgi:hypothetical protein